MKPAMSARLKIRTGWVRWVTGLRRYDDLLYQVKDDRLEDVKYKTFGCGARHRRFQYGPVKWLKVRPWMKALKITPVSRR